MGFEIEQFKKVVGIYKIRKSETLDKSETESLDEVTYEEETKELQRTFILMKQIMNAACELEWVKDILSVNSNDNVPSHKKAQG